MKDSIIAGVGVGAASGALGGSLMSPRNRSQGILSGALIGAAIGGIGSYFIHGSLEKRDTKTRKDTLLNLDKFSVSRPSQSSNPVQDFKLSAPDVDKDCFDWEVKGGKLVQKHCVWTIKGNSFWVPPKE
jgi:hypothetical protein